MKKAGPSFGDTEQDYRLGNIFLRSITEFRAADAEMQKLEKEFGRTQAMRLARSMMATGEKRTEAGVVAIHDLRGVDRAESLCLRCEVSGC